MFGLDILSMYWVNGDSDDPHDLCLHGDVLVAIGGETHGYAATVSAAGLFLLRSVSEDHLIGSGHHLLPCCGHFMIANDAIDAVDIIECSEGMDWSVIHSGDTVQITSEGGQMADMSLSEYAKTVLLFTRKVEEFYGVCAPKILPEDQNEQNAYVAFWKEWHRRTQVAESCM